MEKIVLISGGSDGLGKAVATRLSHNHKVIILSSNEEKLSQTAECIGCEYYKADVADYECVKGAVEKVLEKHDRIDCLINNAGLWIQGELDENDSDRIKKIVEVNLLGVMNLSKAVIPSMKENKSGIIINIISQAGLYAKPERSVYHATKWGLTGFTKCLAMDLAPHSVSVTGLYPGKMNTKLFEKAGNQRDLSDAVEPNEVARVVEFVLETDPQISLPEIGIKHIKN